MMFYLSVGLSVLYVLVQAQNQENPQYDTLVSLNNHTNYLNDIFVKGLKINFNDYLIQDSLLKNVLDIESVLKDSDISFLCDKNIPNLNKSVALNHTKKYPGILLCMGLYHVLLLNGILFAQEQGPEEISVALPKTRSDLDSLINNMNSNNTLKHNLMCKEHKVTLPTYHSDVEEYVKLLNPLLDNENTCETMCLIHDTINPICALIMEANSVFHHLLKKSHVNSTNQVENMDSAKAMEQNSVIEQALSDTKEITDDFKGTVSVNKGNVAAILNKDKLAVLINETNAEQFVPSEQNITSTTPSISKVALDAAEDLINDDSVENTDNAEDYNGETVKQPSPSPVPVETQTKTRPTKNGTLSSQPNSKLVLVEEDNAKEAVEGDLPANSLQKETSEQKKTKTAKETKKKSVTKNIPPSSKTSEKTVDVNKNELELPDLDENLPPPLQDPPAPNEGDNILVNANDAGVNIDEEETFPSNIDQKQQAADPGDSVLDIQENTPYIIAKDGFVEAEDSHFFTYFVLMFVICIVLYVGFYNKRKLLALALEGRAGRRTRTRRGTYSRVNTGFDESKDHLLY